MNGQIGDGFGARSPESEPDFEQRLDRVVDLARKLEQDTDAVDGGTYPVIFHPRVVEAYTLPTLLHHLSSSTVFHDEGRFPRRGFDDGKQVVRSEGETEASDQGDRGVGEQIDQGFVSGLPDDREDAAITRSVIGLAHNLGLKVVAEGIEQAGQARFLLEQHCDYGQGFGLARPCAAEAIDWQRELMPYGQHERQHCS